jgi:hypothetical protein
MAYRDRDTAPNVTSASVDIHPLMTWMSEHGDAALLTELGALAVCTFGAIATDDYWQRRDREKKLSRDDR